MRRFILNVLKMVLNIGFVFFVIMYYCNAKSDMPNCEKDAENFGNCVKSQYDMHKVDNDKKVTKVWDTISRCFKDNGCDAPSSNNSISNILKRLKEDWNDLPKDAKECAALARSKKALEMINSCLRGQKVDEIKPSTLEQTDFDEFGYDSLPYNVLTTGFQQTVIALRKCRTDKGTKVANATLNCMVTIKQKIKADMCKIVDKCRQDKVNDTCQQKSQKVQRALCSCGKSTLKDYVKILRGLEDQGKDVELEDLASAFHGNFLNGQKAIVKDLKRCFEENGITLLNGRRTSKEGFLDDISSFLLTELYDPTGPSHALLLAFAIDSPKYSNKDLIQVREILTDISDNFECGCMKSS